MFDPVHEGHLHLADAISAKLDLPEVCLMPCANPPHRPAPSATGQDRCNMLELALAPYPHLRVDDRELQRTGISYTIDTILSLQEEGYTPLYLLLGSDALANFCNWHNWRGILQLANIVAAKRPSIKEKIPPMLQQHICSNISQMQDSTAGCVCLLSIDAPDISSSLIRNGINDHLPLAVANYINNNKLYANDKQNTH